MTPQYVVLVRVYPLPDGNLICRDFERIARQRLRCRTGKHFALQVEISGMTGTNQLIIELVVPHETAQMGAYPGKGDEAAALAVDDDQGCLVENDFFGSAGRDFIFIDGQLRIFGTAFGWYKKF